MRVVALLLIAGCAAQQPGGAASRPYHPELGPAHAIAAEVAAAAGADDLEEVAQIDFTFVVMDGDQRVFEARHRWDRVGRRAHIEWTEKDGKAWDALLDIDAKTATGTIDRQPAGGAPLAEKAFARFINDTYWLLLPLKLFDPGTSLERLEPIVVDDVPHERIVIRFDGVGLTPGDEYTLIVNQQARRIVRWEMALQGRDGPPKSVTWEDYRPVGPLLLAHDHVMASGRRIIFEDTRASKTVDF